MPTPICLDFVLFPDDHPMPMPLLLAGLSFTQLGAGNVPFINDTAGRRGLQFPDAGIQILIPVPSTRITLEIGQFAKPVSVNLPNAAGAVIVNSATTVPNAYNLMSFGLKKKAATVVLRGGGEEGILARICHSV